MAAGPGTGTEVRHELRIVTGRAVVRWQHGRRTLERGPICGSNAGLPMALDRPAIVLSSPARYARCHGHRRYSSESLPRFCLIGLRLHTPPGTACGRSLSGCASYSLCLPPPGWSCTAGLPWCNAQPCSRRLNPSRTAAARVALCVAIASCADVCRCRSTSLHASFSQMPRGMGSIPAAIDIYASRRARQCAARDMAPPQRGVSARAGAWMTW